MPTVPYLVQTRRPPVGLILLQNRLSQRKSGIRLIFDTVEMRCHGYPPSLTLSTCFTELPWSTPYLPPPVLIAA